MNDGRGVSSSSSRSGFRSSSPPSEGQAALCSISAAGQELLTSYFLEGNDVTGLDVDRGALAVAAKRGITPVRASAEERMPFDDGSFDAVVAGELLEHVRNPHDVVRETKRVLKAGGTLVGSVPNAFRLQSRLTFLAGRPPEDDPTHLHMYSPAQVRRLLVDFEQVELYFVGGRFRRLHPRLLARDLVFTATAPP